MQNSRLILFLLSIIVFFVLGVILVELRTVLLPFVIALLLSNIFEPVVLFLKARRVPTALSLLVVLVAFALVVFLVGLIVFASGESLVREMPKYEVKLRALNTGFNTRLDALAVQFNLPAEDFSPTQIVSLSSITTMVTSGLGSFLAFLTNTFLVLLFMMFILAGSGELTEKVRRAFPARHASRLATVIENIDAQVRQYLITKTLISAGTGLLTTFILWIIGVDFPLLWGFLAFLLNYIPNIGSLMSMLFPLALSFMQFDGLLQPMLVLVLLGGVQMLMGNVLEPKMMAFSLNLSALLVLVSLIFWGWLWGIWGMILAVPLTATVKIIFENIEPFGPVSVLMSGPVGTIAEADMPPDEPMPMPRPPAGVDEGEERS